MENYLLQLGIWVLYYESNKPFATNSPIGYKIIVVKKGELEIKVNEEKITLKERNVLLVSNYVIFEIRQEAMDLKCFVICFTSDYGFQSADLASRIMIELFMVSQWTLLELNKSHYQKIIRTSKLLHQQFENSDDLLFSTIVLSNFNLFLMELASAYFDKNNAGTIDWRSAKMKLTINFYKLIQKNFHKNHNLLFYAESLSVSCSHLGRVLKQTTGKSGRQLIDELILHQAKRLLGKSDLNISEIAEQLGFESVSQFSNYFKKHVDLSPSQYKAQNL